MSLCAHKKGKKNKEISSKMRPVFEFDEIFAMEKRVDAFDIDSL